MANNQVSRRRLCALLAAALPGMPLAFAQSSGAPENSDPVKNMTEIIVTAQKRQQNLQDVPIVVTAVSGQLLQDTGVKDIKDLTILTPGLTVTSTTSEAVTTARIRGIGTVGDNPGLESSVGVVIDGVYRPRNGVGFGDLGEMDRIEVLKGPQGTLFGKNTSAGVINILTKQPDFNFRANATLSGGNYSDFEAGGSLNGPIVADKLAGRLYAARSKRDGFYDTNIANGPRTATEDADRDLKTARGQLLFRPSEDLNVRFIGDYTEREENCCVAVQSNVGASAPIINALAPDTGVGIPADPFARRTFSNRSTAQDIKDKGASAEVNWDLKSLGASLTSITAWRDWRVISGQDSDFSTADIWYRSPDGRFSNEFEQVSQELRLAGVSGKTTWLVGAFYANEDLDSLQHLAFGTQFEPYYSLLFSQGMAPTLVATITGRAPGTAYPLDAGLQDKFKQKSDSYAVFTNDSYQFTDKLEGTIGLRYTNEDKKLDSVYSNIGGGSAGCAASRARAAVVNAVFAAAPAGTAQNWFNLGCGTYADPAFNAGTTRQSINESEWSGTAKLAFRFTDDVMSYVSYARGYKAGGFNLDRERIVSAALGAADPASVIDPDTSFAPEKVDSYELGTKTNWLRRSLLVNATAFYEKFENFQLNTYTGISFVVASIPEVTSKGVDLDFLWVPAQKLSFQGGVTYAETVYGNFTPGPGISPRLPNNNVSFAPRWSGTLAATFSQPLGASLLFRTNVGAKTTSAYNTGSDLNPAKNQSAYTIVNARIGLGSQNDRWMLEAWGQNLLNRDYYQLFFDAPLQTGTYDAYLGAPRTYGLTLRVSF
jgi:outer membrane receptor protein involved in Fe transport